MTTENLPPVATAGGPPTATGGTILVVPAEAAAFDQEFLDNYDLDAEGGDDYTLILFLLVGYRVSRSCRRSKKSNCSGPRLLPPRR
jgi:hypothetical protein